MMLNHWSHLGTFSRGKRAPLRKKIGRFTNVCMTPKLSRLSITDANTSPILTSPKVIMIINGIERRNASRSNLTPTRKPNRNTRLPCYSICATS